MTGRRKNSRFIAHFTVTFAFFVALFFPVGYFVISHQYAMGNLEAEAEINARIIAGVINANPELWQFERDRLEGLLSRRPQSGHRETRRILNVKGAEIAASGGNLQAPVIRRSQPLMDAGNIVGWIEISRSLLPILKQTGVVAVFGLAIGYFVFILLPLRAISRAEGQLRDSYSFLTRVMESSTNAIIVLNPQGTIEMVNDRCIAMSGYSRDELYGSPVEGLFMDCAGAQIQQELGQVARGMAEMVKFENDLLRRDGTIISISCGAAPIFQEGHIAGIVLSAEDIMERKLAAEQLRQAKEYTENLIQAASVIIVGLNETGVVTLLNRTAEEITGYYAGELMGKNWFETVTSAEAFVEVGEVHDPSRDRGLAAAFENQIITKSGAMRTISWRNSPILENGKSVGTLCFGIDITEHKKIEAQLRQSQKMESIGQLAGGVAHDFNNMLSVILGYAQLCQLSVTEEGTLWQYLQEITKAGERSRDMVRQLLAFSRKEIISPRAVNLNIHCIETEKTLSRLIGEEIRLTFLPFTNLWTVKIDPSQADQVLMNLAVNARDAMSGGGNLTLETANVHVDEEFCHYHIDARPGDYACLTVKDTGTGMDQELIKRIFEPFFTTKEVGKGTGLGLSTVYGIVTQNGGFIDVKSARGQGTAFMIYLPRLQEETQGTLPDLPEASSGSGTVLVVEDDAMVCSMTTQMLEKIGYEVIQTETPQQALAICRDNGIAIDLVLSDVVMPGMTGREMAQEMARLRPGLKVLFMSGYSSDMVAKRGIIEQGTHFIRKPFDIEGLNQKILETHSAPQQQVQPPFVDS